MPKQLLLSRLVYESVRDSIQIPNGSFMYPDFINTIVGRQSPSTEWSFQTDAVWSALNLGLSRLYDNEKTPFFTQIVTVRDNEFDFGDGEIANIVKLGPNHTYENLEWRSLGINSSDGKERIEILNEPMKNWDVVVEYRKPFPHFDESDLSKVTEDEKTHEIIDENVDLASEYGLTSRAFDYLKEFIKGQVTEVMDASVANLHNNRAEQYFNDLKTYNAAFNQMSVRDFTRRLK